jgi:sarcosine/dimethylglycine N-methyltransferase
MADVLEGVRDHYRSTGLVDRLKASLGVFGTDDRRLLPHQLGALDQFHTRGLAATAELGELAGISAETAVLDIGAGVGGPARFLAATYGCRVIGVDLSEPFVDAARYLTERTGLSGKVSFQVASALELPCYDESFDVVLLQHVAMHICERERLYAEIQRVLKTGGRFATFDVVARDGDPYFPLPWARTPTTSFLLTPGATRKAIEAAGFRTLVWQDDSEVAKTWIGQMRTPTALPTPNLGTVMGPDFGELLGNLGRNLVEGRLGVLTAVFEAAAAVHTNDQN